MAKIPLLSFIDAVNGASRVVAHGAFTQTEAESTAAVTPFDFSFLNKPYDIRRVGLVPNNPAAAAFNASALNTICHPNVAGPPGRYVFPNIGGNDKYYIGGFVQLRSLLMWDLDYSELVLTKSYVPVDDNLKAFLMAVQNVSIENGIITIDYDGTGGTNAGMGLLLGSRQDYVFGSYSGGIYDDDDNVDQGNIILRNLTLKSNNPNVAAPITMLGGIQNCLLENLVIDGQGAHSHGIYYEFGYSSKNGSIDSQDWSSSHSNNLVFRNIRVTTLYTSGGDGGGIGLVGAGPTLIENLSVDGAKLALEIRPGEAMYFRPWSRDVAGVKRCMTLRNITGQNITSIGIKMEGASDPDSGSGYLSGAGLTESQKTDLIQFSLDGFSLSAAGAGILVSGQCDIRNGQILGDCGSGGIIISDECVQFDIANVRVRNGTSLGIRASFNDAIWSTPRLKMGTIRNCQIAGNTGAGISIDNCRSVLIQNCRIGYNTLYDPNGESTQTIGVAVSTGGSGVICRGNYVTTSGGAVAYQIAGTGPRGCGVYDAYGTTTVTGIWENVPFTFTVTLTPGTSGSISAISGQNVGRCLIQNKHVTVTFRYGVNTVSSPVGTLTLGTLPIATANNVNGRTSVALHGNTLGASTTGLSAEVGTNATTFQIQTRFASGSWTSNAADIVNSSVIVGSLTYLTD